MMYFTILTLTQQIKKQRSKTYATKADVCDHHLKFSACDSMANSRPNFPNHHNFLPPELDVDIDANIDNQISHFANVITTMASLVKNPAPSTVVDERNLMANEHDTRYDLDKIKVLLTMIIGLPYLQTKFSMCINAINLSKHSKWTEFNCKPKVNDLRKEIDCCVCFYGPGEEGWSKRGNATHTPPKHWKDNMCKTYLQVNPMLIDNQINIIATTIELQLKTRRYYLRTRSNCHTWTTFEFARKRS